MQTHFLVYLLKGGFEIRRDMGRDISLVVVRDMREELRNENTASRKARDALILEILKRGVLTWRLW